MLIKKAERSVAGFERLRVGGSLGHGWCFGLNLTAGVLGHLTFELTAALNFDFRVIQIPGNTASAMDEDMVMADDVFCQNTMYINNLRIDLTRHAALGTNLQIGHCDLAIDGPIDAGAPRC